MLSWNLCEISCHQFGGDLFLVLTLVLWWCGLLLFSLLWPLIGGISINASVALHFDLDDLANLDSDCGFSTCLWRFSIFSPLGSLNRWYIVILCIQTPMMKVNIYPYTESEITTIWIPLACCCPSLVFSLLTSCHIFCLSKRGKPVYYRLTPSTRHHLKSLSHLCFHPILWWIIFNLFNLLSNSSSVLSPVVPGKSLSLVSL